VVIDAAALGKGGAKDVANIQRLVRGAMGFDAARGDLVEVQTRSFASETDAPVAWYEAPVVRDYGLYIIGLVGVLIVALAAGFFLWRRRTVLAAAATATAEAASAAFGRGAPSLFAEGTADKAAVEAMIDGGELLRPAAARDYSGKLDIARTLVTGDRDRAMAVARQMLLADLNAPAPVSAAPALPVADDEDAA
jgi:flagellar M-ring protein FliF